MSEPIISIGIGFLLAVALIFGAKLISHSRFGRLARKRLEAAAPKLMADIEADMGQLHSQIAVATRRLEISVEQMKAKTTSQLAEIGRSSEAIGRLKGEIAEKVAAVGALQEKESALAGRLHVTEADLAAKSSELAGVERTLAERKAELARFMSEFDVHPEIAKVRQVHLAEMEALRADKGLLEEQLRKSKEECSRRQFELDSIGKQVETT